MGAEVSNAKLIEAAVEGDIEKLKGALELGADVNHIKDPVCGVMT